MQILSTGTDPFCTESGILGELCVPKLQFVAIFNSEVLKCCPPLSTGPSPIAGGNIFLSQCRAQNLGDVWGSSHGPDWVAPLAAAAETAACKREDQQPSI